MITDLDARLISDTALRTGWRYLCFRDTIRFYGSSICLTSIALIMLMAILFGSKTHGTTIFIFPVILLSIALIIYVSKNNTLRFDKAKVVLTDKEYRFIVKKLAKYYDFEFRYAAGDIVILQFWDNGVDRIITLLRTDEGILLNSITMYRDRTSYPTASNSELRERLKNELEEFARGGSGFGTLANPAPDEYPKDREEELEEELRALDARPRRSRYEQAMKLTDKSRDGTRIKHNVRR